jgi:hypothetical protein
VFATSHNIFPSYLWLATLVLAAATPPFLYARTRLRGRSAHCLARGAVIVTGLCGAFASLDLLRYWQIAHDDGVADGWWWVQLSHAVLRMYARFFANSAAVVFLTSSCLTLLAHVVLRPGPPPGPSP